MEQKELRDWEAKCIQEEPAACRAGCPLGVDGRAFAEKMSLQDLASARIILEKSMPLPEIIGRICEGPCEKFCQRKDLGGAVSLNLLERFCVESITSRGKSLRLPPRQKKVIAIGGGPSTLTLSHDLAKKGYPVTVYYCGDKPGSWLNHIPEKKLPEKAIAKELSNLSKLGVVFHKLTEFNLENLQTAECLFIGQDDTIPSEISKFITIPDQITFALPHKGWFIGGMSAQDHPHRLITDVSQGREAAVSIDRFLQGASLTASRLPLRHGKTKLITNISGVVSKPKTVPESGTYFNCAEAIEEANRCLNCQCLECVKHCKYLQEYGGYPKTYARRIYNNSAIVKGSHQANKLINSCSLCDQCAAFCPNDFSMAELCLQARQAMVSEKRMPPSAHWFALEEMRSAHTETMLLHHAPDQTKSRQIFFPGCQLAGLRPEQTLHLYESLLEDEPQTGIWLDCCGAPAHWSGNQKEHRDICDQLINQWENFGNPVLVTACTTCFKIYHENLPTVTVKSVWDILKPRPLTPPNSTPLALSDPCTARNYPEIRSRVRSVLKNIHQPLEPFPLSAEHTECCGFGGLMENANPELATKVSLARTEQTKVPILTYCAMCRDQLARTGRPVVHILDLLFPDLAHDPYESSLSISARRSNRRKIKSALLERIKPNADTKKEEWQKITLKFTNEAEKTMDKRRILVEDIQKLLSMDHEKKSIFLQADGAVHRASAKIGEVTFWVQYQKQDKCYLIENCWSHRMTISRSKQ